MNGAAYNRAARILLLFLAGITLSQARVLAPVHAVQNMGNKIPNKYIIVFKHGTKENDVDAAITNLHQRAKGSLFQMEWTFNHVFKGFAARMDKELLDLIRTHPGVNYIKEDEVFTMQQTNYTDSGVVWNLDRIDQRDLPLDNLFVPRGDGLGVNAYVIDTGIYYGHNEFENRAKLFADLVYSNPTGGEDCNGHGSHVSGTIGGKTFGVAKKVSLWSLRVFDCSGGSADSTIIKALDLVAEFGEKPGVVSMSLGGFASQPLDDAVEAVKNLSLTVVVAAGNSARDACNYSPSRSEDAITVGSSTSDDTRSSFSNYGPCLDLFAPGSDVTSAWIGDPDAVNIISGTSMATPHVSGSVAVLLGLDPSLSPEQVLETIVAESSAAKLQDTLYGSPNKLVYIGAKDPPAER